MILGDILNHQSNLDSVVAVVAVADIDSGADGDDDESGDGVEEGFHYDNIDASRLCDDADHQDVQFELVFLVLDYTKYKGSMLSMQHRRYPREERNYSSVQLYHLKYNNFLSNVCSI